MDNIKLAIIYDYNADMSIEDLQHKYNLKWEELYSIIAHVLHTKKIFDISNEECLTIVNEYARGISMPKIAFKHRCYHKTVGQILKKYGLSTSSLCRRKYAIDEHYFDDIDTPNKAYILGILMADGNNNLAKGTVSLNLLASDIDLLNKVKQELKTDISIRIVTSNKNDGYNYKPMAELRFFSMYLCNKLKSYGMVENKSLKLKYPDVIPYDLQNHFIRGYFDGNGSLYQRIYSDNRIPSSCLTITSTYDFCEVALNIIRTNVSQAKGNIYDASCHNGITSYISMSGNIQVKCVLDWLYNNADIFLYRKYQRYQEYYHVV